MQKINLICNDCDPQYLDQGEIFNLINPVTTADECEYNHYDV